MGACGNVNVNANANFFEHDLLWLADARYSSSLQKITEKTEKYRNCSRTLESILALYTRFFVVHDSHMGLWNSLYSLLKFDATKAFL